MTHLSRFSEDLIIWNTYEFGFIDIGDEYTTGSSIMPQKKNPDILELIRGKTSSLYGNLINILGNLKGLLQVTIGIFKKTSIHCFHLLKQPLVVYQFL